LNIGTAILYICIYSHLSEQRSSGKLRENQRRKEGSTVYEYSNNQKYKVLVKYSEVPVTAVLKQFWSGNNKNNSTVPVVQLLEKNEGLVQTKTENKDT
jgi:hypothetical protein